MDILDRNISSGNQYGTGAGIRPNMERAGTAVWLLYFTLAVQFIFMVVSPMLETDVYSTSQAELLQNALIMMVLGFILVVVNVLTIIFFIRWFRRAYFNLHLIDARYLSHSEGWAAGAWFVPVVWWFWPYMIMKQVCSETESHASRLSGQSQHSALPLAGWWWATWILPMGLGFIAYFIADREILMWLTTAEYIVGIICGLIIINMIKRISVMEQVIYDNRQRAGLQSAPGYVNSF